MTAQQRTPMIPSPVETAELGVGQRLRHRRHHDLTGRVAALEYREDGKLSAIPYNVLWDSDSLAHDRLGMFCMYASDATVEAVPEPMDTEG